MNLYNSSKYQKEIRTVIKAHIVFNSKVARNVATRKIFSQPDVAKYITKSPDIPRIQTNGVRLSV